MTRIKRFVSGAALGVAVFAAAAMVAPRPALAQGGFCDESGGRTICCSTDAQGKIIDCVVVG